MVVLFVFPIMLTAFVDQCQPTTPEKKVTCFDQTKFSTKYMVIGIKEATELPDNKLRLKVTTRWQNTKSKTYLWHNTIFTEIAFLDKNGTRIAVTPIFLIFDDAAFDLHKKAEMDHPIAITFPEGTWSVQILIPTWGETKPLPFRLEI